MIKIKKVLDNFVVIHSKRLLEQCLLECMELFPDLSKPLLSVRKMRSRWGSCRYTKGSITLNSRLLHVPYECIQYVVIHELLHFYYPDHQKGFHEALERLVKGHRKIEKRLQEYGFVLEV